MRCKECENKKRKWSLIKGDGWCEIHKTKFFFNQKGQICPICAKENKLCNNCGKSLLEDEPSAEHIEEFHKNLNRQYGL
jgi:hypothetical protein